jgi:hypothetical protein
LNFVSLKGKLTLSIGVIPWRPLEKSMLPMPKMPRDDLPEGERHDGQVVAAQAQRRGAEDDAPNRGEDRRDEDDEEEVDVDARDVRAEGRLRRREEVDALAAGHVGELLGAQPAHDERADREEGHVAEVEQPGEADHDVQPQGHDDVGQGLDRGVQQVVGRGEQLVEDVRVQDGQGQEDEHPGPTGQHPPQARGVGAHAGDRGAHRESPLRKWALTPGEQWRAVILRASPRRTAPAA